MSRSKNGERTRLACVRDVPARTSTNQFLPLNDENKDGVTSIWRDAKHHTPEARAPLSNCIIPVGERAAVSECGDTSPLSDRQTCLPVSKRGRARAVQIGKRAPPSTSASQ